MTLVKVKKPSTVFPSVFDEFWRDWTEGNSVADWVPAANITEEDTKFHIELSAPGYDKKDIKVAVEDDTLTITGEMKMENEEKNDKYLKREFRTGNFKRSFNLNGMVDVEKINAKYENGILKVDLPKVEQAVKKMKEIKVG